MPMNQTYQKTPLKQRREMNRQNYHICTTYELLNNALLELIKADCTILICSLGGASPHILIQAPLQCSELRRYAVIRQHSDEDNLITYYLERNGCGISWNERNQH